MIRFIPNNQIDKKRWDKAVAESSNALPFALTWYLDAVTDKKWDALVSGDYEAVCPIVSNKKLGIKYLFTPFFVNQLGVFFKGKTDTYSSEFIETICKKYKYVDVGFNYLNKPSGSGVKVSEKNIQYLDLSISYEELRRKYSTNVVRNLNKATKATFTIGNVSTDEVVQLFKKHSGEKISVLKPLHYKMLNKLLQAVVKNKAGFSIGVYDATGKLAAAAAFTNIFGRLIYLKGGVNEKGRESGAMHFLFDHIIRKYANQPTILDFGGSSVTSVARFYKSFGASDYSYLSLKYNALPLPLKLFKK